MKLTYSLKQYLAPNKHSIMLAIILCLHSNYAEQARCSSLQHCSNDSLGSRNFVLKELQLKNPTSSINSKNIILIKNKNQNGNINCRRQ